MCTCVFVYLLTCACGYTLEQAQSLNISDSFLRLSFSLWLRVGVSMWMFGWWWLSRLSLMYVCMYVCTFPDSVLCLSCLVLSCLCLVLFPGSTLSAQSVPTMYPGELALLAPGGLADSGSSTQLQPLKPSPSSNNLCSAYTSEGTLSVPSLCAPTPGRHMTENPSLQHNSHAFIQKEMHAFGLTSPTHSKTHLTSFSIFLYQSLSLCLSVNTVMANCYTLAAYSFHLSLSFTLNSAYSVFLSSIIFPLSSPLLYVFLFLHRTLLISSLLPFHPSFLSSGCVKFSWGSERLAFKPGGRRTRFLSTPCLALCV